MLDGGPIATFILQEAHHFATKVAPAVDLGNGRQTPHADDAERFGTAIGYNPLPEFEPLARVIEETFWASVLEEERRPCRPRLLYAVREPPDPRHMFATAVPLDRHSLRKLSPAQGFDGFLTWNHSDGGAKITGLH